MNALLACARKDMIGAALYLAGVNPASGAEMSIVKPCQICLRLIKNAGIDKVITRQGIIYYRNKETGILEEVIVD
jgi:dCMP deaminase